MEELVGVMERRGVVGRTMKTLCRRVAVVKRLQVKYVIPKLPHKFCFQRPM